MIREFKRIKINKKKYFIRNSIQNKNLLKNKYKI